MSMGIFYPGQLVVVRGGNPGVIGSNIWRVGVFSFSSRDYAGRCYFLTEQARYKECLPLEGNQHLVGTSFAADTPSDGGPVSSSDDDFVTSGGDSVRDFGTLCVEIEALRSKVNEKTAQVKKLEAKVCRVASEKSELLERYRDLEASRCGLEDSIIALLAGKDRSAGDFNKARRSREPYASRRTDEAPGRTRQAFGKTCRSAPRGAGRACRRRDRR